MSSFFKQYDNIINDYIQTMDNQQLLMSMETLLKTVSNSVNDAMFITSHTTLKNSINQIITKTKQKMELCE